MTSVTVSEPHSFETVSETLYKPGISKEILGFSNVEVVPLSKFHRYSFSKQLKFSRNIESPTHTRSVICINA